MDARKKINPDEVIDPSLQILNDYRAYLIENISDKNLLHDAIKVVDCARFVKVNEAFLRFAFFADKKNKDIYSRTGDGKEYVIRDFNGTSLNFIVYQDTSQYPDQKIACDICIQAHLAAVQEFEESIIFCLKAKKLYQFSFHLEFDENVGCFPKRTAGGNKYVSKLKSNIVVFEELLKSFMDQENEAKSNDSEDSAVTARALDFFKPYFQKECLFDDQDSKTQVTILTPNFLISYLVNKFGYEDVRSMKSPETKFTIEEKQESKQIIRTYANLYACYQRECALAKNMSIPLDKPASLTFHINKLSDPANFRPTKRLPNGCDRTAYWDTTDGIWHGRQVAAERGGPKPLGWKHGKKESTTLKPRNGKINLFHFDDSVFFVFDLDASLLKYSVNTGKEKYVWMANVKSDDRFWLDGNNKNKFRSTTIKKVREHLRKCEAEGEVPDLNEILACLSREGLVGIGTQGDTLFDSLNLLRVRDVLKSTLGVHLPMVLSTPENGPRIYSRDEQIEDLGKALTAGPEEGDKLKGVLKLIHEKPSELINQYNLEKKKIKDLKDLVKSSKESEALAVFDELTSFSMKSELEFEELSLILRAAIKNKCFTLAYKIIDSGYTFVAPFTRKMHKKVFLDILETGDQRLIDLSLSRSPHSHSIICGILFAAKANNTELVLRLLKIPPRGFDIDSYQYQDKTALYFAFQHKNPVLIKALKDKGAKMDFLRNFSEHSKDMSIKRAVLRKIAEALKAAADSDEKKALIKDFLHLIRDWTDESSDLECRASPSLAQIEHPREVLMGIFMSSKLNSKLTSMKPAIHASLIALCQWWPRNGSYNPESHVLTHTGNVLLKSLVSDGFGSEGVTYKFPDTEKPFIEEDINYLSGQGIKIYQARTNDDTENLLWSITIVGLVLGVLFAWYVLPLFFSPAQLCLAFKCTTAQLGTTSGFIGALLGTFSGLIGGYIEVVRRACFVTPYRKASPVSDIIKKLLVTPEVKIEQEEKLDFQLDIVEENELESKQEEAPNTPLFFPPPPRTEPPSSASGVGLKSLVTNSIKQTFLPPPASPPPVFSPAVNFTHPLAKKTL